MQTASVACIASSLIRSAPAMSIKTVQLKVLSLGIQICSTCVFSKCTLRIFSIAFLWRHCYKQKHDRFFIVKNIFWPESKYEPQFPSFYYLYSFASWWHFKDFFKAVMFWPFTKHGIISVKHYQRSCSRNSKFSDVSRRERCHSHWREDMRRCLLKAPSCPPKDNSCYQDGTSDGTYYKIGGARTCDKGLWEERHKNQPLN